MNKYRNINNPKLSYMLVEFFLSFLAFYLTVKSFPFVTANPLEKYWEPYLIFIPIAFFCGIAFKKFQSFRKKTLKTVLKSVLKSDLLALGLAFIIILILPASLNLSAKALSAFVFIFFILELIVILIYFSFKYAINIEKYEERKDILKKERLLKENYILNEDISSQISNLIEKKAGINTLNNLRKKTDLTYSNTLVIDTTQIFDVENLKENRFSTIINLAKTNDIRGISKLFISAHDKLPYKGQYVGCFRSKSQYKKEFLAKYPVGINLFLYVFDFFVKRVFPKWEFTREIYFWLTDGKKRIVTKPEIFGRLYASGFEIKDEFQANGLIYFIAEKTKEPIRKEIINYGPIIKLNRIGKNGKVFNVYKFRTMHPYSEFLQPYIYEKNNLQEGGKFNHDIRVTSIGGLMRKYWLDELPMFLNLLKGDMKIVGVRPLSKHYFNLYSEELKQKRISFKPGLLPPFYADMPKTLEDIQASEMKYLTACEKKGIFITDIKYFWLIFVNIFFKKARSK